MNNEEVTEEVKEVDDTYENLLAVVNNVSVALANLADIVLNIHRDVKKLKESGND